MPISPKTTPLAASAKATGKPTSRKIDHRDEDDRRHIGDQKFAHRASPFCALIASASSSSSLRGVALGRRVRALSHEKSDAFDQFRNRLHDEQKEAGGNHQARRPDDQPAGAVRHFTRLDGVNEDGPRQHHDGDGHRHQEENDAEDVDPGLTAFGKAARDQVDAHVFVAQEGVSAAGQRKSCRTDTTGFQEKRSNCSRSYSASRH